MSLFTSSSFASTAVTGTDWRDTSKLALEQLQAAHTEGSAFNFGFLYVSDALAEDAESILNPFKSVLNIEHWVGSVGVGVCGQGEGFVDQPAISAMVGRFEPDEFCFFPCVSEDLSPAQEALGPWMKGQSPVLVVGHGDPLAEHDLIDTMRRVGDLTQGFLVGGLTSSRGEHLQFANEVCDGGLSGVAFSPDVRVASVLSQGFREIGCVHTVTRCDDTTILELDSERAVDIFEGDLRSMVIKAMDCNPDDILVDEDDVPEEYQSLFEGNIEVGFLISESDQNDYMVRHIAEMNGEEGSITLATTVAKGDRIVFVKRDDQSVFEELSARLLELRARVTKDEGVFAPKGALYISCIARAMEHDKNGQSKEMDLVHEIIGDVPLCGFYAGGEISNARLYGYTSILVLFL